VIIRGNQRSSVAVRAEHLRIRTREQSRAIQSNQEQSRAIKSNQEQSNAPSDPNTRCMR
jgi:hypothetical protein